MDSAAFWLEFRDTLVGRFSEYLKTRTWGKSRRFVYARRSSVISRPVMLALARLVNLLDRINSFFAIVCRQLIILIVAVLTVILVAAVVWRYGLNSAISWAEEGSKYLMVWLTFLGTPVALRQFGHINIDLLLKALPPRLRQLLYLMISMIILFTMAIILWHGAKFTHVGMRQVASSFNLSMLYMYIAVPIGAALTCLVAFEQVLRSLMGIRDPERGLIDTSGDMDYVG